MHKHDATQQDAQELSRRHDGREQQRPKLFNRVQNAQLSEHRCYGQNQNIARNHRMPLDERNRIFKRPV